MGEDIPSLPIFVTGQASLRAPSGIMGGNNY
jgi:hypothetical protein